MTDMTRRAMLTGSAGVCAAALLAACGGDAGNAAANSTGAGGDASAGQVLGGTGEVPVGGGKVFRDKKVVVSQPTAGDFVAFSAICPHAGQIVGAPANGTITCPYHGSQFSATDGSLEHGPATKGLTRETVKVEGDHLVLG